MKGCDIHLLPVERYLPKVRSCSPAALSATKYFGLQNSKDVGDHATSRPLPHANVQGVVEMAPFLRAGLEQDRGPKIIIFRRDVFSTPDARGDGVRSDEQTRASNVDQFVVDGF